MRTPPVGIRQNNPGNLRPAPGRRIPWAGLVPSGNPGYLAFSEMWYGVRASAINFANRYRKRGARTIADVIRAWAPSEENNTENYIRFVGKESGFPTDHPMKLDSPLVLLRVLRAMFRMENGRPTPKTDWVTEAELRLGVVSAAKYLGVPLDI